MKRDVNLPRQFSIPHVASFVNLSLSATKVNYCATGSIDVTLLLCVVCVVKIETFMFFSGIVLH